MNHKFQKTIGLQDSHKFRSIRIMFFAVLSFVIFFALAGGAEAATYYIDYETGNDTNNGTSNTTPWKHSPGDPRATGNSNIALSAGDTVVFKGGVTYSFDSGTTDYLAANASGASGNIITYRSGHVHAPQWGITRAIIDGTNVNFNYDNSITGVISLKSFSYIKVEGFQIQYAPWSSAESGLISWRGNSGGNIIIDNNVLFSNISPPNTSTTVWVGIWIQGNYTNATPSSFTITNNEIYDIGGHGILLRYGMSNVLVANNIAHDCGPNPSPYQGDGIFTATGGNDTAVPTTVTISNNTFYDFAEKGCLIIGGLKNSVIERNYCYDDDLQNGFGFAVGGSETGIAVDDVTFRNNLIVFSNASKWGGLIRMVLDGGGVSDVKYYNNTLIGTSEERVFNINGGAWSITDLYIINNIIFGSSQYYIYLGSTISGTFESNYNLFYGGAASPFYHSGTAKTLSTWQSNPGQDNNSQQTDPLFQGNNKLTFNSPAKDTGLTIASFSTDYDGVSRPKGSAWDIGAYEYVSSDIIPPSAPSGLSVQ